ncbi:cell wall-binding repeat-containing protein [Clostridium kluyveri]|uniref:Cell wall-binding repeat 2 family protein n=1 Tax=Clostridium kluyveri TaxID=1534 RepID=A0A1L5F443_CLOKL|nr:cell wall-binding repeat-containing protein [Clostridium kluyveri]APM37722.1 hypothetical protein BS101_02635 [Clostridium kluyveri]
MKNKKLLALVLIVSLSTSPLILLKCNRAYAYSTSNGIQNVVRIGGTNRFDTSSKIAEHGWKQSDNVVLVGAQSDIDFADALAGTPLAYSLNAPILLTNIISTPDEINDEISKLKAKNIYILGGTGTVSQAQENIFKSEGYAVTRIAGATRYDTAIKIADELNNKSKLSVVSQSLEDEVKNMGDTIDISKLGDRDQVIKDGNVVMISTIDSQDKENKNEVYNTKNLDQFIRNFNNFKEDKVRIIKYVKQGNQIWINKLADIKYDGKNLIYVTYDIYSGANIVTDSTSASFTKIVKTCSNNNVRYILLENEDTKEDMGVTVLSFSSNSIKI